MSRGRVPPRLPAFMVLALVAGGLATATDWPHLRGPEIDGRIRAPGTFEGESVGLNLAWRAPLGAGYSGIAIADGRAVTLFTDGSSDFVVALDAASGKEAWRYRIDAVYKGHDGSDDGPISSPAIAGGLVYAVGNRGQLLALRLADGTLAWSKHLATDFGAPVPHFGFATTPLPLGELVIVQVGAPSGRSIVALASKTGEVKWSAGDDGASYQSPSVMTLAGVRQVVAIGQHREVGIAPETGKLLWSHELGESDDTSSANPTSIDGERFLAYIGGDIAVFRVRPKAPGFEVEEMYRTRELGWNYAPPVMHEGYLYGFRGDFLSCVDASNGARMWRSRPPGGKGLILVDGHLVVFGAQGNVAIVQATPQGYKERARFQALGTSALTWPSFADGRVFVRNAEEVAALNIIAGAGPAPLPAVEAVDDEFGRWVKEVEAADNRRQRVAEFLKAHATLPIVEGDYVHFIYLGDASDVALEGSWLDAGSAEPMKRIKGTDLFHKSVKLEPGGRWEYRFQVDFDKKVTDDRNPRRVPAAEGDDQLSELVTPGYKLPAFLSAPTGTRGRIETFKLTSKILGYEKEIRVWLPPDYDGSKDAYPLLVVNDGSAWLDKGQMATALDNLVAGKTKRLVVAFVPAAPEWWLEGGGSRTADYARMQAEELVPALRERYRLSKERSAYAVMGNRFFGASAAWAALTYPEIFGRAGIQSASLALGSEEAIEKLVREKAGTGLKFYVDWNRYDERVPDMSFSVRDDSKRLQEQLTAAGYDVTGGEMLDSHGWGGWPNRLDRLLAALFPGS